MTFEEALPKIKKHCGLSRDSWEPCSYIYLVTTYVETTSGLEPHKAFCLKTIDDKYVGWLPSFDDIMANDWGVVHF